MTPQEYAKLLEYANKNNGWRYTLVDENRLKKPRPLIKYITSHLDTRKGRIWLITFKEMCRNVSFRMDEEGIREDIHNYLNGNEFKYGIIEENK